MGAYPLTKKTHPSFLFILIVITLLWNSLLKTSENYWIFIWPWTCFEINGSIPSYVIQEKSSWRTNSNQIIWSIFIRKNCMCYSFKEAAQIQSFAWGMGEESEKRNLNIPWSLRSWVLAVATSPFPLHCKSTVPIGHTHWELPQAQKILIQTAKGGSVNVFGFDKVFPENALEKILFLCWAMVHCASLIPHNSPYSRVFLWLEGAWTCCLPAWGGSLYRWGRTMQGCTLIHSQQ